MSQRAVKHPGSLSERSIKGGYFHREPFESSVKSGSHQKELDLKISEDQFLAENALLDTEIVRHFCEADVPDLTAAVYRCLLCYVMSYLCDGLQQCHSELSCLAHYLLVKGKTAKFSKHTRGKKQDLIIENAHS